MNFIVRFIILFFSFLCLSSLCSLSHAQNSKETPKFILKRSIDEFMVRLNLKEKIVVVGAGRDDFNEDYYRIDILENKFPDMVADITTGPFPENMKGKFDMVIFEHLPVMVFKPVEVFRMFLNASYFLRPGGKLLMNSPFTVYDASILDPTSRSNPHNVIILDIEGSEQKAFFYKNNPYSLYRTDIDLVNDHIHRQDNDQKCLSNQTLEHIAFENILYPVSKIAGFEDYVFSECPEKSYWRNEKNIHRLFCLVRSSRHF